MSTQVLAGSADTSSSAKRPRVEQLPRKPLRIAVEGNIATGKSTFLDIVDEKLPTIRIVQEPIERWTAVDQDDEDATCSQHTGGNLLGLFYADAPRWAYTFQTYAFLSRLKAQMNAAKEPTPITDKSNSDADEPAVFLLERSIYSDRLCFAANCHASGLLSDMEYTIYTDFHTFVAENFDELKLDGIIYLQSDPEICNSRRLKRGRDEESDMPLDYLRALHDRHEDWLIHKTTRCSGLSQDIPILVLDCNVDFVNSDNEQEKILSSTKAFIDSLVHESKSDRDRNPND